MKKETCFEKLTRTSFPYSAVTAFVLFQIEAGCSKLLWPPQVWIKLFWLVANTAGLFLFKYQLCFVPEPHLHDEFYFILMNSIDLTDF